MANLILRPPELLPMNTNAPADFGRDAILENIPQNVQPVPNEAPHQLAGVLKPLADFHSASPESKESRLSLSTVKPKSLTSHARDTGHERLQESGLSASSETSSNERRLSHSSGSGLPDNASVDTVPSSQPSVYTRYRNLMNDLETLQGLRLSRMVGYIDDSTASEFLYRAISASTAQASLEEDQTFYRSLVGWLGTMRRSRRCERSEAASSIDAQKSFAGPTSGQSSCTALSEARKERCLTRLSENLRRLSNFVRRGRLADYGRKRTENEASLSGNA